MTDPMEQIMEAALIEAGVRYRRGERLDFELPDLKLFIEVKQFHTDRIAGQLATAENVIVAQGRVAVEALASLIRRSAA